MLDGLFPPPPPQNRKLSNTQQVVVMMAIAEIFRCECRGNGVTLISFSLSCQKSYDISESPPFFLLNSDGISNCLYGHPCTPLHNKEFLLYSNLFLSLLFYPLLL